MLPSDDLKTSFHFGLFTNNNLIGVCSFFKNSNPNVPSTNQYQLRGMAILKTYQGQGFGKVILRHGEKFLGKKNIKMIWCNAREVAVPFYQNNNYMPIGNAFNIKDIGLHYVMYKIL
ncbi:GNAT family N-acetyltransferase [Algibacter sp. AS12]|uniref:GNAT family N-acetyltransferase n=1 Tax=Algibacter sp. AS12 TaxID=3135773 RepID=UPI00398B8D12